MLDASVVRKSFPKCGVKWTRVEESDEEHAPMKQDSGEFGMCHVRNCLTCTGHRCKAEGLSVGGIRLDGQTLDKNDVSGILGTSSTPYTFSRCSRRNGPGQGEIPDVSFA